MRILHIPQAYKTITGGGERHVEIVARLTAARGHEVHVLGSDIDAALKVPWRGWRLQGPVHEVVDGLHVHRHEFRNWTLRLIRSPFGLIHWTRKILSKRYKKEVRAAYESWVRERIETLAPDVVVTQAHLRPSVHATFKAKAALDFPVVFIPLLHMEDASTWQADMREYARSSDAIITLSHSEKEFLRDEWHVPDECIFPGLLGTAAPDTVPVEKPGDTVLVLGRLDKNKGLELAFAAMEHVWRVRPQTKLVIAGASWRRNKFIDARMKECSPEDRSRIELHVDVDEAEKARLIREARCLTFLSRSESFGFVILEAWSHGVPVVVWDVPLFQEIVGDDAGWRARPGSVKDFARCILRSFEDDDETRRRGLIGRERLAAKYGWDDVIDRYEKAYMYAISRHKYG
jgi:glycosyltransferase involved in cell wall biosynthesis